MITERLIETANRCGVGVDFVTPGHGGFIRNDSGEIERDDMKNKYLQITIHDSDYSVVGEQMGYVLMDIFKFMDKYPKEEDLEELKEYVASIWWAIHQIDCTLGIWRKVDRNFFLDRIDIKIVTEDEMISVEDSDMAYICVPLFESDDILFGRYWE